MEAMLESDLETFMRQHGIAGIVIVRISDGRAKIGVSCGIRALKPALLAAVDLLGEEFGEMVEQGEWRSSNGTH